MIRDNYKVVFLSQDLAAGIEANMIYDTQTLFLFPIQWNEVIKVIKLVENSTKLSDSFFQCSKFLLGGGIAPEMGRRNKHKIIWTEQQITSVVLEI